MYEYKAVTKISSCRLRTTSRRGIKQLGISLVLFFISFPMKVAVGNPWPPPLNASPDEYIAVLTLGIAHSCADYRKGM